MRILLIIPYGGVGGIERLAQHFYAFYKKNGYEVYVLKIIQLKGDIVQFNDDELALSTKDLWEYSTIKRFAFYAKAPKMLRNIIRNKNITHSIAFGDMANVFSSLTFTKEKKIASIHAVKSIEFSNKNMLNVIFKYALKSSYRNFDKVVCIGEGIKTDLQENIKYPFNNLVVIYNPHDFKYILEKAELPIEDPNEAEIFEAPVILYLGRLSNQKAPWHLVRAFAKCTIPNVRLVFIGDGSKEIKTYLENQLTAFGIRDRAFFLGRKNNPYKYIKASKIVALSSYYEGTPNVIVEALSLKTPVVTPYCTPSIMELMSINNPKPPSDVCVVEGGIVTPNLFKGALTIPSESEYLNYTHEETKLGEAFTKALNELHIFENSIDIHYTTLLDKFDLKQVANAYTEN